MANSSYLAMYFPHTMDGSLGSFRRIKEIAEALFTLSGRDIRVYSPFENAPFVKEGIHFSPIPGIGSNSDLFYDIAKSAYYSPFFSRTLLPAALSYFGKISAKAFKRTLLVNPPAAIQAELDVSLPAAVNAGKALGLPVIADIHNITSEELVASGALKKESAPYARLQSIIGRYLAECDLVVVVSDLMKEYVVDKYSIYKKEVIVVPPAGKIKPPISTHRRDDSVVYAGTVSYRERVDLYVRAIQHVKTENDLSFYITGKGDGLGKILKLSESLNSKLNTFWLPEERDFFSFLSSCTVGVLTSSSDVARKMGTPLKLFDYMSAGLPFVSNDIGGWCSMIKDEDVGVLTGSSPLEIGSTISSLLQDPDYREKISKRQLHLVKEKYNWFKAVRPLYDWYEKKGIL